VASQLEKNVYCSGQINGTFSEQALFLRIEKNKIIILVGCSHPGLEHFILKRKQFGKINAVIGGFHGFKKFSYSNDIEFIGARRCTQYTRKIQHLYPLKFRKICVGDIFKF
jgi:7,8-dihydropterin-6-yl-methyl-4-(beta-D-ribofuranosyl)aminobenzene 5'-phosphate synthase